MLKEFGFRVQQTRRVAKWMEDDPGLRPDDRSPADVTQMLADAAQMEAGYMAEKQEVDGARGSIVEAQANLHDACVALTMALRSAYRKDFVSLQTIRRLPVRDQTAAQTQARGQAIVRLWKSLPPPPGRSAPFALGPLDAAAFEALVTALDSVRTALADAEQTYRGRQARVRDAREKLGDFVTAAFAQSRAFYLKDTAKLQVVNTLPRRRSTPVPPAAELALAASPQPGAVRLECAAKHATSFEVWHQGPGESGYERVAVVKATGRGALVYETGGWTEGEHVFQVAGVNSRGTGKRSAAVTVQMAQQVAA